MTTDKPQDPVDQGGCPPPGPDPGCDPKLVDSVACEASGVAARAEYNASYSEALAKAKTDYDQARKDYRAKRHDLCRPVDDKRDELCRLVDQIRCQIKQKRVWRCLDDAFCDVERELDECDPPEPGCCVTDCDFDIQGASTWSHEKLVKRIAKYQAQTDAAKACFDALVGETAALQERYDKSSAKLEEVKAALGGDEATTDLKRVYAQALVARRDFDRVWGGFDETQQYVDCLCRALTCWTKGCAAVSVLKGALAVIECQQEAAETRCENLRTNTVDEVLAAYDKRCGQKPCKEDQDGGPEDSGECPDDGGGDDDDDCGCHHHHHHKHGKGKHHGRHHDHHTSGCGCHDTDDADDTDESEVRGEPGGVEQAR